MRIGILFGIKVVVNYLSRSGVAVGGWGVCVGAGVCVDGSGQMEIAGVGVPDFGAQAERIIPQNTSPTNSPYSLRLRSMVSKPANGSANQPARSSEERGGSKEP